MLLKVFPNIGLDQLKKAWLPFEGLAGLGSLGAALAHQLHAAAADGEGHDQPAKDKEDKGKHEAGVVAVGVVLRCSLQVVSPSAVGSKNNHGSPNGKPKITEPHHAGDEAEEVESTLLSTGHLAVLHGALLSNHSNQSHQVKNKQEDASDIEVLSRSIGTGVAVWLVLQSLPEHKGANNDLQEGVATLTLLPLFSSQATLLNVHTSNHISLVEVNQAIKA